MKKNKKESSNTLGASDIGYRVFEQEDIKWLYVGDGLASKKACILQSLS